jgi:hypothetical protein
VINHMIAELATALIYKESGGHSPSYMLGTYRCFYH